MNSVICTHLVPENRCLHCQNERYNELMDYTCRLQQAMLTYAQHALVCEHWHDRSVCTCGLSHLIGDPACNPKLPSNV
jgi:hypothetical protein